METIKIKCPAKINLNLKVTRKRPDGFHDIESVMQTISLYDYLQICVEDSEENVINLSGNSPEIPYNEHNLVYKAVLLYLSESGLNNKKISINIEKNIPVAAGLAGGSTDAAGTLYGLNKIFKCFDDKKLHSLCAALGSDLNVCLMGGRILAKGRGEILQPYKFEPFNLSLIKPIGLGISAKEAYTKFSYKFENNIDVDRRADFENDLEWAIINDYPQLLKIKSEYMNSVMTGSGSTYFIIGKEFQPQEGFDVWNNLEAISKGVCEY